VKADCLTLLRRVRVGRLVFTARALPAVRPVCFSVDGDDIVIRTAARSGLADEVVGCVVALQADQGGPRRPRCVERHRHRPRRRPGRPEERRRLLDGPPTPAQRPTTCSWSSHLSCRPPGWTL
jgi:hypothetical protein